MNLVIGIPNKETIEFVRKMNFKDKTIIINKICNIKFLTENVDLYIPFKKINRVGLVDGTMVHLEELIITLNVKKIYYSNSEEYIQKMSKRYNVEIEKLNYN